MSQLIWTRALDDWETDRVIFERLKRDALHLPCIAMQASPVKLPRQKPQVFVFTSANAVRYAARHYALVNLMKSAEAVYAIGAATFNALAELRVPAEIPENVQTAQQFAVWLSYNLSPNTIVAWPSAREPSYNLQNHLTRYNIQVEVLAVYHTEKALHLPNGKSPDTKDIDRDVQTLDGVVCFASPSSVDGFIRSLTPSENRLKKDLIAVAIGPTTHAAAEGQFEQIIMIKEASVELLAETAAKIIN